MKKTRCLLLVMLLLCSMLIFPGFIENAEASWLGNWKCRRSITIDHDDVGASLIHFPVLIYLSSSSGIGSDDVTSIFDEIGDNSKKIAVTEDDGTTQLYVEIDKWDSTNEKAWLWVSLSGWTISKLADTTIYIYYDNAQDDNTDYVGDIEARPEVWNDNFKLVWHMRDKTISSVADSTSNNNDGTKGGEGDGPLETANGKIDDAQQFDGNTDIISLTDASLDNLDKITIECWINPYTWGTVLNRALYRKVGKWNLIYDHDDSKMYLYATWTGSTASWRWEETPTQSWTHLVVSYDGTSTANDPTIYYNNVVQTESEITAPSGDMHDEGLSTAHVGAAQPGTFEDPIEGTIDEFRISDINRPASWVKATYETGRDHFVTYGSEESDTSPPSPDPPTWASAPYETSSSSISMEINTCTDDSPPVQYYIDETTHHSGWTDKGWSTTKTHTDSGLSENTQYGYKCQARDDIPNTGGFSPISYEYTDIDQPTSGDFDLGGTITSASIAMEIDPKPPNYDADSTGVYFEFVSGGTGGNDRAFSNDYTYTDGELQENTQYTYRAKFRNGDGNDDNEYCSNEAVYTYANAPSDGEFSVDSYGNTWIKWKVLDVDNNPEAGSTGAYFDCLTGGVSDSGWILDSIGGYYYYNATELSQNTTYGFRVKYQNAEGESTTYTNEKQETTRNIPELTSPSCEPASGIELVTTFTFNVTYSDADGDDPVDICVNISLGTWYINNSMAYVSGDNITGAIYTNSTTLPTAGMYNYKFLAYDGYSWNETAPDPILVGYNTSFELNLPTYLEVGDYIYSFGTIKDSTGTPLDQIWVYTKILDSTDWSTVPLSDMEFYVTNGFYQYVFSTSTMIPGIYNIIVNYTYSSFDFSTNRTLWLSVPGGPGHSITSVFFTFYDGDTGVGIEPLSFKVYVDDTVPLDSNDRIYGNEYPNTYTGATLYYRIDDYFDNQIYPTSGTYETVSVTEVNQFVDIPIIWTSFSVKNMNHSIVYFKMTNASRTYSQYLYPYEPFYWNVLPAEYTINLTYYNPVSDDVVDYHQENITITDDTYYWIRGYDLQDIILEIQITNSSLDALIISVTANVNISGSSINTITTNIVSNLTATETNITNLINSYSSNFTIIESIVNSLNNTIWANFTVIESTIDTINNKLTIDFDLLNVTIDYINNTIWANLTAINSNIGTINNSIHSTISIIESNLTALNNNIWSAINITDSIITYLNNTIWSNLTLIKTTVDTINNNIWTNLTVIESDIGTISASIHSSLTLTESNLTTLNNNIWSAINITDSIIDYLNLSIWSNFTAIESDIANLEFDVTVNYDLINSSIDTLNSSITSTLTLLESNITSINVDIQNMISLSETNITSINYDIWNALNITDSVVDTINNNIWTNLTLIETTVDTINNKLVINFDMLNVTVDYINNTIWTEFNTVNSNIGDVETNVITQISLSETNITNLNNNIWSAINITDSMIEYVNNTLWSELNYITNNISWMNSTTTYVNDTIWNNFTIIGEEITILNISIHNAIDLSEFNLTALNINIWNDFNLTDAIVGYLNNTIWTNFTMVDAVIDTINNKLTIDFDMMNVTVDYLNNTIWTEITAVNTNIDNMENTVVNVISLTETNITTLNNQIWNSVNITDSVVDYINNTIWNELSLVNVTLDYLNNTIWTEFTIVNSNIDTLETTVSNMIVLSESNLTTLNNNIWNSINITDSIIDYLNNTIWNEINAVNVTVDYLNNTIWTNLSVIDSDIDTLSLSVHTSLTASETNISNIIYNVWSSLNISNATIDYLNASIWNNLSFIQSTLNNTNLTITNMMRLTENNITSLVITINNIIDYALMPDIEILSVNPPTIFSVYQKEGMALGGNIYHICPALIVIATTEVEIDGNWINSTARTPGNNTVENGTVIILDDTLYLSGSATWVNITYGNGTLMQNTSYVPSKINLYGQNLTINASCDIHSLRETTYNQVKQFYWVYDSSTGEHTAGIDIINPMNVPIHNVYAYVEFSNKSTPDPNTVVMRDTDNDGLILERGEKYDISLSGIHFHLLSIGSNSTRGFTIEYTKRFDDAYRYGEDSIGIPKYDETVWKDLSYNTFTVNWHNDEDTIFRGALHVKLNFEVPTAIDRHSIRIWDDDKNTELSSSSFIFGIESIRIDADVIGDVNPGGGRTFHVYFLLSEVYGVDPTELHFDTPLFLGISIFLIILIIGIALIGYGAYTYLFTKNKSWWKGIVVGVFLIVFFSILTAMGI